jgi:hypothetical protein
MVKHAAPVNLSLGYARAVASALTISTVGVSAKRSRSIAASSSSISTEVSRGTAALSTSVVAP